MAQAAVCSETELRKLRPAELYTLGQILTIADSWKKLMAIVPREGCVNLPKFNAEHFSLIEQAAQQQRRSAAEIFLDEWSTMGRKRPTLKSLLELLVQAQLFRAADYVAGDVLKGELPKRPERGPAAAVDISDEALEKLLKENYSPDSDSSVLRSEITTEQFLFYPEELLDAAENNRSTKLASEENHVEESETKYRNPVAESSGVSKINDTNLPGNSARILNENHTVDPGPSFPVNPPGNYQNNPVNFNPGCSGIRAQVQENLSPPVLGIANSPNLGLKDLSNLGVTNSPNLKQNSPNLSMNQSPNFRQNNYNPIPGPSYAPGFSPGTIREPQTLPCNDNSFNNGNLPVSDLIKFSSSMESSGNPEAGYTECKTEFIPVPILRNQELPTEELPVCLNSKIFPCEPSNSDFNIPIFINTSSTDYESTTDSNTGSYNESAAGNYTGVNSTAHYGNFPVANYDNVADKINVDAENIPIVPHLPNDGIRFGNYTLSGSSGDVIIDIDRSDSSLSSSNGGNENEGRKNECSGNLVNSNGRTDSGNGMDKMNAVSNATNFLANEMNSLELPVCIAELSSRFDSNLLLGESKVLSTGGITNRGIEVRRVGAREEVLDSTELPVTVLEYENV